MGKTSKLLHGYFHPWRWVFLSSKLFHYHPFPHCGVINEWGPVSNRHFHSPQRALYMWDKMAAHLLSSSVASRQETFDSGSSTRRGLDLTQTPAILHYGDEGILNLHTAELKGINWASIQQLCTFIYIVSCSKANMNSWNWLWCIIWLFELEK